ncbi:FKBP-type peptidyl-prolyl cis-trans isomerase N-terminal domain-containing protein [Alienimonas sp. DA493]|uniref:FKBP-type peptidyl-prolyl cis-trans isomerase N-terminal domain-containing protein n=1 Tax=Alienimonas sp. DA493 TaxID=3373605 RepID=UPI0037548033
MNAALLAAVLLSAPAPQEGGAAAGPAPPAELTEPQKLSYALGVNVGRSLLADGLDPDPQLFLNGLRDALTDAPVRLSDEEIAALLAGAAERVRKAELAAAEKRAAASRAAFEALAEKPGFKPLSTGEVVRFDRTGEGPKPAPTDRLRVHYTASLAGEEVPFFATRGTNEAGETVGEPIAAPLRGLLPGLRTVLPTVPVGSEVTVGLPPDRAYGPDGGPGVPPNAALTVTVELLDVLPAGSEEDAADPAGTDESGGAP